MKRITGNDHTKARNAVIERDGPLCLHCLKKGHVSVGLEMDHINPLHKGGDNSITNLQMLCRDCHDAKTRTELGWKDRKPLTGLDGWPVDEQAEKSKQATRWRRTCR